jgi:hypothetical protein
MADQQLHAEAVLQAFDRRDRRLGDVQLARGLGDAAAIDGDEVLQLTQIVGGHGKPQDDGLDFRHLCAAAFAARRCFYPEP